MKLQKFTFSAKHYLLVQQNIIFVGWVTFCCHTQWVDVDNHRNQKKQNTPRNCVTVE